RRLLPGRLCGRPGHALGLRVHDDDAERGTRHAGNEQSTKHESSQSRISYATDRSSIDDRLHDERLDQLPIVPANGAWRVREKHHGHVFLRINPEHRALRAAPEELAGRARHPRDARLTPYGHAETEAEPVD